MASVAVFDEVVADCECDFYEFVVGEFVVAFLEADGDGFCCVVGGVAAFVVGEAAEAVLDVE